PNQPNASARNSSVNEIGKPMKITPIMTISITSPRTSLAFMPPPRGSYLYLLFVLQLDAGARRVDALDGLGHALHQQQQHGERHHGLEGPEYRPPRRLVGCLPERVRVPGLVCADHEQSDQ